MTLRNKTQKAFSEALGIILRKEENNFLEIRKSTVPGAGDGLFAASAIDPTFPAFAFVVSHSCA